MLQEQAERAEAAGVDVSRRLAYLADACDKYARARGAPSLPRRALQPRHRAGRPCARHRGPRRRARAVARGVRKVPRRRRVRRLARGRGAGAQQLGPRLAPDRRAEPDRGGEERATPRPVGLFREALRRDPTFHRAAYNLGTVFYALSELAQRRARAVDDASTVEDAAAANAAVAASSGRGPRAVAVSAEELQTAAAMYICCARRRAGTRLRLLPAPRARHPSSPRAAAGRSGVAAPARGGDARVLDEAMVRPRPRGVLDGGGVAGGGRSRGRGRDGRDGDVGGGARPRATRTQLDAPETRGGDVGEGVERESTPVARANAAEGGAPWGVHVRVDQIVSVQPCADVSLPRGFGLHVDWTRGAACFWWLTRRRRGRRVDGCGSRGRSRRGGGRRRFERSWHRTSPSRRNSRTTRAGTRDDSAAANRRRVSETPVW